MKTTSGVLMVGFLVLLVLSTAYAERYVVVNGQRLSIPEIQYLEQLHCGPVPNGRYWINLQSGMWGYEGSVEKSRQRRSRHFSVLTYSPYAPRTKMAAALLNELF